MNALEPLKELGVEVQVTSEGKLRLRGGGPDETKKMALSYARRNREALIAALSLPTACPLLGNPVPRACQFERRLFHRMVTEGTLPIKGTCPLLKACGLARPWPNT